MPRLNFLTFTPVSSSHLSAVAWDSDQEELYIEFYNGAIYTYFGVPFSIAMQLLKAPSAGQYFWQNIRGRFPYTLAG